MWNVDFTNLIMKVSEICRDHCRDVRPLARAVFTTASERPATDHTRDVRRHPEPQAKSLERP